MGSTEGNAGRRSVEIELKGKQYTIRELDFDEYDEMEAFLKSKQVKLYRATSQGVDPEIVEATVTKIIRASYSPEELSEEMAAPACVEMVAYLALRHNPGVTRESIREIVDLTNVARVSTALYAIGGGDVEDVEEEGKIENPPQTEEVSA